MSRSSSQGSSGRDGRQKRVIGLICQWCTSGAAENLGGGRTPELPVNVQLFRLPCTGNVDPVYLLTTLLDGADAVFVSGCHPGDCHYVEGNIHARRRVAFLRALLDRFGIARGRLSLSWIATGEMEKFRHTMWEVKREAEHAEQALSDDFDTWQMV